MENVGNIDEERGDKAIVDTLLSDTFNSILRIEERSLKNRLTDGLSIAELHTIVAVGLHEVNSMKVVASRLDVTMATLTAAMNKLERKGFVERSRSEIDRRQVLVQLTSKGRKAFPCPMSLSIKKWLTVLLLHLLQRKKSCLSVLWARSKISSTRRASS